MKKSLIAILTTTALLGLAGSAMAQSGASPAAATVDPSNDPNLMPDATLAPDQVATTKHKLKFKIKGVQADDDGDGESADDNGGGKGEGSHGDGDGESNDDNG